MKYEIVPIDKLLPLEQVFPSHLKNLEEMIDRDGVILKALIVDKKTGTILDGSHRYVYFLKRGYKEVPVYYSDYDDENVRVGTRLCHRFHIDGSTGISKDECRARALSGDIFPPRTTRHFFTFRKSDISVSLDSLKRGEPVNVDHLISNVDTAEEIAHNEEYIREINKETELIVNYLSEVSQTKKYLTTQIELMKASRDVAFLPGKFHPPHIGHILTILKVLPKYRRLIIGVTEDIPEESVTTAQGVVNTLNLFFESFDNVDILLIRGVLTEKKSVEGLPGFDVLLSGNEKVLDWARDHNVEALYIPRSEGFLCGGTEVRSVLQENGNA
jgi:nicotinamide mononucleotide adenylyltransferase